MNAWLWCLIFAAAMLLYVQVIYPAICALAGLRPVRRAWKWDDLPTVSLIVPAYNEESVLAQKLENALAIDYPAERLEVIVASDGSDDGTNAIARNYEAKGIRFLDFSQRRGKASVINDSVAAARGEIVCLCDANVMFGPKALMLLVNRLADPRMGAVTGEVRLASSQSSFGAGERLYYYIERSIQLGESRIGSLMGVDGGMYVVRKSLFRPLPRDTILDDFVVAMHVLRQGYRVAYEPQAIATENGTPLARQEFRRRVRVTAGAVQSISRRAWPGWQRPIECWQYLSHKAARWLMPFWLMLFFAGSAVLAVNSRGFQVLLAVELLACCAAVLAATIPAVRRFWPVAVVFYFALSQAAMLVGFAKGICGRQRVTWTPTARLSASQTV